MKQLVATSRFGLLWWSVVAFIMVKSTINAVNACAAGAWPEHDAAHFSEPREKRMEDRPVRKGPLQKISKRVETFVLR